MASAIKAFTDFEPPNDKKRYGRGVEHLCTERKKFQVRTVFIVEPLSELHVQDLGSWWEGHGV